MISKISQELTFTREMYQKLVYYYSCGYSQPKSGRLRGSSPILIINIDIISSDHNARLRLSGDLMIATDKDNRIPNGYSVWFNSNEILEFHFLFFNSRAILINCKLFTLYQQQSQFCLRQVPDSSYTTMQLQVFVAHINFYSVTLPIPSYIVRLNSLLNNATKIASR